MISEIHHEKYHEEFSMSVAVVCDMTHSRAVASFYDVQLDRLIARSVIPIGEYTEENAAVEAARLIFMSLRHHNISAGAVRVVGVAAPHDLASVIEEALDPADIFLRPDTMIVVLPYVSVHADARFAAMLAAIPLKKGVFVADFGKTLNMAYHDGEVLSIASVELSGAFDATAIEYGMATEYGAIDELYRADDGKLCYCVIGDIDACGIAAPAILDAMEIMLSEGIVDSDGIMTDRDQFYIGEDYFLTQRDVRVLQADKARAAAAVECFLRRCGEPVEVYISGEALSGQELKHLESLRIIPREVAAKAQFCRSYTESGLYECLADEERYASVMAMIRKAVDISYDLYNDFDDLYITNLQF